MKTLYKNTQYGILLNAIFLIIIVFLTYAYSNQIGNNPLPLMPYLILILVFSITFLMFYKLTIRIDTENIEATFGIGLLKKSIQLDTIQRMENYKIPWYVGIGIRLTPKGWLWNVSSGQAILIKTEKGTFLLGSNEVDEIIQIINNQIHK